MESPRVVLTTGANSGIGRETVKALLRSNNQYHIILASVQLDLATSAVEVLRAEITSKSTLEPAQVNIEDDESILRLFQDVSTDVGGDAEGWRKMGAQHPVVEGNRDDDAG
ncbi:hypothetical protein FE257_012288 [Aspergillus nanangensis]|uniref:Uncharacterized protein n=1 Tax=Aspergillus nanangensis TaxID=2582783 RepID=A0AAD4CGD8_ASPNN|nr:hypothetical protein FE257_012288 [Aspergillus nanangensis]